MAQILQTFILPTDDIFRRHASFISACDKIDITRLAIAERAIDPFLRAIRRLGVADFTRQAAAATDPARFALHYSEGYYEKLPDDMEKEFLIIWREICTIFLLHGSHIYGQLAQPKPRLSVVGMIAGDVEIGLLSDSHLVEYI
jgi:hypothetical protein